METEDKDIDDFLMKLRSEFFKETRVGYTEVVDNLNTYLFQK